MRLSLLVLAAAAGCATAPREDAPLVLADHGKSEWRIVIPKSPTASERFAAQEFARILEKMTGVLLSIVDTRSPIRAHEISINARIDPEDTSVWEPGSDGYWIGARSDLLYFAGGRPRGAVYAVYHFFEEALGCRWFTSGVEFVPRREKCAVPSLSMHYRPLFEYRETFYTEAFDGDFAARLRSNGNHARLEAKHGGKLVYFPFVHTFDTILPAATHFKDHPEYYAEIDGRRVGDQLCLSNPDVLRLAIECVKGWITAHPEATIFSVSQNDNVNYCRCATCRTMEPSEALLKFVNAVAKACPEKLIDTLAYQYTRKPPKNVVPRENVRVRLCSIECCFSHPIESCPVNASFRDDLIAWSKITNKLYVWDYVTDFSHYLLPFPNLYVLGPNARFFSEHGVKGVFEEGNYSPGGGGEMSDIRTYLIARVLWNPWTDVQKDIQEFTDGVYGEAAPIVREYIDLLHERAKNVHFNIWAGPDAAYLQGDFLEKAEKIFARMQTYDPAVAKRLRKLHLPLDYLRYFREKMKLADFKKLCVEHGVTHVSEGMSLDQMK